MITKTATVKNKMGIHVRPTGVIIHSLNGVNADVTVKGKGMETDLCDHMGLLAIGLCEGDTVEITVNGEDEEKLCSALMELFEREFDFPPRH